MYAASTFLALAAIAVSQAVSASSQSLDSPRELISHKRWISNVNSDSNTLVNHRHRARHGSHRNGSLRKRCTRKSSNQITISGDDSDDGSSGADSATDDSSSETPSKSNSSSNSTKTSHTGPWLKKNCITFGWITDDGDHSHGSTGSLETPAEINKAVGTDALFFGAYGHIQGDQYKKGDPSTYFDGKEVLPFVDYLKGTGAMAVLSIMPVYGWGGLTSDDNTQALQTVKVLQQFDDAGIDVYLRFGHEMNWYTQPNSDDAHSGKAYYAGGPSEYIEGWKTMASAVKDALPNVKMFWSPNIGSSGAYAKFWPGKDTVDLVGVDYYPHGDFSDLASHVQDIHDTYAKANDIPFHLGETGSTSGESQKAQWIETITSEATCNKLSHFEAIHWFNYDKGGDFRVAQPGGGGMTAQFVKIME